MTTPVHEAIRDILYSTRHTTDPSLALEEAAEDLPFIVGRKIDDLTEDEAVKLRDWLLEAYPDRTASILRAAVRWSRR
ncbi:MAG: hypothetical protein HYY06_11455 [Deltaproteobacteria bacterium]|nr:hypothetical protein [Deltaproteobacteria bacterium]